MLKEYVDVFAWSYEDLKTYDTRIIHHEVPLKLNVKPFRQKLRRINTALFPIIEKEEDKSSFVSYYRKGGEKVIRC